MTDVASRLSAALADRYAIQEEIGAGGMATVYLAEDLKHHRKVALKILRPELAAILGAERFLKEIEVTANLQHPNILPLYDSGEADTFLYYVMPYIEGESLRDKLNREKQLGIEETVEIAKSVAAALSFAHSRGVIHRDIKPDNILLQSGQALVADFGIALAVSQAGGTRLTETGLSLGTPHYMSPEQATGDRELDARSDIYSLGCVSYEMLVGEPPHVGNSVQAILAKILSDTPAPITRARELVPPNVDAAVQQALARSPADRFTNAAQFAEALTNPAFTLPTTRAIAVAGAAATGPWNRLTIGVTALAAILLLTTLWGWLRPASESPTNPVRFAVALPLDQRFADTGGADVAFSPDGSRFVYRGQSAGGAPQLFVRAIDDLETRPVSGTEGASQPFFSPDGQWLGFYGDGHLKKVQVTGGPSLPIVEIASLLGASWGANDVIVFGTGGGVLMQVAAAGGTPEPIATLDTAIGETSHRWPELLPGGDAVAFTSWSGSNETARIAIVSLASGRVTHLSEAGTNPHYTVSGHLVYTRSDGSVVRVPFDIGNMTVTGQAIPLIEGVALGSGGVAELAISRTGSLVYLPGGAASGRRTLVMVDRQGVETPLTQEARPYTEPRFSPTGDMVAVQIDLDIWVYDVEQGTLSVRTFEGDNHYPTWTPDGTRLIFSSERLGQARSLYSVPADGSSRAEPFFESQSEVWESALSPDGRWLAIRTGTDSDRDILAVSLDGEDRSPRPFAQPS
ncbi:MAG: protein kinase, partial [Gemmatimonadetes bacterium]|nr:protein kinase [Gemmatimonadota bacterium]